MKIANLRSPHDGVGGVVHFGRMLDKIRLQQAGKLPADYQANLGKGFDGRCCQFLGIKFDEVVTRVKRGGTDEEILGWCFEHGRKPAPEELEMFSGYLSRRGWRDDASVRLRQRVQESGLGDRPDIQTFFDLIDADEERPLR